MIAYPPRLYYQGPFWVIRYCTTKMFDFFAIFVAKIIKPQTVLFLVHNGAELCLKDFALSGIHKALKNRVLHPLAIIHTLFCNLS